MQLMRGSDRAFAARAVASGAGVSVEEFEGAKRGFKMAAFQGGLPAMVEQGWKPENGSLATDDDGNILGLQDSVPGDLWVGTPPPNPCPYHCTASSCGLQCFFPVFPLHVPRKSIDNIIPCRQLPHS